MHFDDRAWDVSELSASSAEACAADLRSQRATEFEIGSTATDTALADRAWPPFAAL